VYAEEYEYIGECNGNNGNGCFIDSPGHDCGCFTKVPKEEPKDNNFYEKLKQYFEETPREKILEDWAKSAEFNKVGPTVDDFLNNTNKQETLEEAGVAYAKTVNENHTSHMLGFHNGAKWQQEQNKNKYSVEEVPTKIDSILAKITHQNDLGLSEWYEVVYYDNEWCSFSGSKTFEDGEKVIEWEYCEELLKNK
jgi:hypothetical protein